MGWLALFLLVADIVLVGMVATGALGWPPAASVTLHVALLLAAAASSLRRAAPPATPPDAGTAPVAAPLPEPIAMPDSPPPADPEPAGRRHILLVEDEADLRALVQRILQEAGYEVSCASDAQEARAALQAGQLPDALVTDLSMPGEDGVLLAGEFRRLRPRLPVLFTSGYPDRLERIEQQGMESVATLAKPFPPDQLLAKLEQLLGRGKGQGEARG